MCGIAGVWHRNGPPVARETIGRFIGALAHRGPDGSAVAFEDDGRLALGHRRLAILDLSDAGHQPMRSMCGRFEIVYNGAIYNFLELRAELEAEGFRFRSSGDTEVILAAYERWGADCLLKFNGMWSFAIWETASRRLFLARDRFGEKPLYMFNEPGRFVFASELKAFLHLDGFVPQANTTALEARLAGNFHEHVLLRGVEALAPGHWMEVTQDRIRLHRWWNTLDHLIAPPRGRVRQAEEFRDLFFDACRLQLRSDAPLATSLSGGLDSASVLSATAEMGRTSAPRQGSDPQQAFIASFPGTLQDETELAEMAAKHARAIPVVKAIHGGDVRADIDAYLYQFEEIGGLFGIAAWTLYREMRRQNFIVSLDGHGSDELLGGYSIHIMQALLRGGGLLREPCRTLDLIGTLHGLYGADGSGTTNKTLLAALTIPTVRRVARKHPVARRLNALASSHTGSLSDDLDEATHEEERAADALGPLTGALYRSFHRVSLPRILRNFDVHSMGHGVEMRMPFLDWRLVCYVFSTPDASKAGHGMTKRLLREAMTGLLPEPIRLRRRKLGYNAPVADWLSHGLRDWLWDEVNDPDFLRSDLWDGRALCEFVRTKRQADAPWSTPEAHRILLAVSANWWLTRWPIARTRQDAPCLGDRPDGFLQEPSQHSS
jgi:asparagine synthase (glutamine-hydrolysing)